MYLTPIPGVDRNNLIETLRTVETSLSNVRSQGHIRTDLLMYYSQWAAEAVRLLRGRLRPQDLDTLVLTRRYWALQASTASTDIGAIVEMEIDDRRSVLGDALHALTDERDREAQRAGRVVVTDTTLFCAHPQKLELLDLGQELHLGRTPIRVVVPILVIDELDNLKDRGPTNARWRPLYTLAVLERVLDPSGYGELRPETADAGRVTVEIEFDPPGHRRLEINDDEIVDRAVAIQAKVGRPVTLLSSDTGMTLRARTQGLDVHKFIRKDAETSTERSQ